MCVMQLTDFFVLLCFPQDRLQRISLVLPNLRRTMVTIILSR